MEPIFTEEQLNKMSRENIIALITAMQKHRQKQEDQIRILQEKTKELEFLNAMLSDRLTLALSRLLKFSSANPSRLIFFTVLSLARYLGSGIYKPPSMILFATTTIRPFLCEYSQVESVSSLSPYSAVYPVS